MSFQSADDDRSFGPDPRDDAEAFGREAGQNAGSWMTDGNTSEEDARAMLFGWDAGDPEILDMMPAPLSGELAGESIPELSERYGIDLSNAEIAAAFEQGFSDGFWSEVVESCSRIVGSPLS